jgi:YggT family protein
MGAADASLDLLLDAVSTVQSFVTIFYLVYTILLFAYILMSWFRLPYSLSSIQRFLHDVCEPYLRIFRRFIPPIGPLDLSPVAAFAVLYVAQRIANDVILDRLH